jgi:hypothetical protein
MIVWEDVGEAILGTIAWEVCEGAGLISSNVFQFFEFFAKSAGEDKNRIQSTSKASPVSPKIGVCRHQSIMFGEVLD